MCRISKPARCAAAIALFLLASRAPSQAQTYRVTDLGTLAGDSRSVGYGLNDLGQAAGLSSNPTAAIATLFSSGKATSLDSIGAEVSVATAISGSGQAAGYFNTASTSVFHAFVFTSGRMIDIHSASLFPAGSIAYGINGSGQAVGEGLVTSSTFHVFLYTGGQMVDLGTLGGFQASASAINDSGQIAGNSLVPISTSKKTVQYEQHAFLYSSGKMADLGVPSGAYASGANAINGNGQIAGVVYPNTGPPYAALFSNGVWTDLGVVAGASSTQATEINIAGQVVGTAVFPQVSYSPPIPGKHIGFIVSNGALVDLNTRIPTNSGFTITDAVGINGSGQILCNATNTSGFEHAVLLTPG